MRLPGDWMIPFYFISTWMRLRIVGFDWLRTFRVCTLLVSFHQLFVFNIVESPLKPASCLCTAGYFGDTCQSSCKSTCTNGTTCQYISSRAVCACPEGTQGDNCEHTAQCNDYCHNGGVCNGCSHSYTNCSSCCKCRLVSHLTVTFTCLLLIQVCIITCIHIHIYALFV